MDTGNFTEDEKRFVLAEFIKASQVDTAQLVAFIKQCKLQPDWFMMQLPGGRNLHQCMRVVSSMLDSDLTLPIVPNLKKRKSSDLLSEPGQKRLASMPHPIPQAFYQPASQSPAKAPPLPLPLSQLPHQQHIQPRPPPPPPPPESQQSSTEGYGVFQSNASSNGYGVFQSNPTGRKRGRPSKAEKEAQARASVGPLTPSGPIPISPKPTIQPSQGPPTSSVSSCTPSYTSYAAAAHTPSTASRDTILRAGSGSDSGGQVLPSMVPYQPYSERMASSMNAEKSPSIGNLVTADPPADSPQRGGDTAQQGGNPTRESPSSVSA